MLLADVETTQETSEARVLGRWERGYLAAEDGTVAGQDAVLGGRWAPLSFAASLHTGPGARESVCAANAAVMAAEFGCVSEYSLYRVDDAGSARCSPCGRAAQSGAARWSTARRRTPSAPQQLPGPRAPHHSRSTTPATPADPPCMVAPGDDMLWAPRARARQGVPACAPERRHPPCPPVIARLLGLRSISSWEGADVGYKTTCSAYWAGAV